MMQNMMSGMADSTFFWIALITLICLLIIGMLAWLIARWLNKQKTSAAQHEPQPRDAYEEYEQGYRTQQQPLEAYQEGEQRYAYPQNEQGSTQYQEMEQLEHQYTDSQNRTGNVVSRHLSVLSRIRHIQVLFPI